MTIDLVSLEKGLKAEFNRAYAAMVGEDPYSKLFAALATRVPSNSNQEKYGFLGDVPSVKEWIGDKTYGALEDYDYTIKNKDFYTAIGIDRNELDDDQMGIVRPRIQMMVQRIRQYQGKLIANLIINGASNNAYDSNAYFADRTSPNDNLLAGNGTTVANLKTDIYAARAAMMQFESDEGEVLGLQMDTIVCPPELEGAMYEAVFSSSGVTASSTAANTANPINTWIKNVIVLPNASDADDWYGFATGFPIKPFIYQARKEPVPVLDDTSVKRNRHLGFSAEMRGNAGYGMFHMGVKMVNS
jgi:phage major head subunit gpT-like protein